MQTGVKMKHLLYLAVPECTVLQSTELVHQLAVFSPCDVDRCNGVCIQLYLSVLYCSVLNVSTDLQCSHQVVDRCHGMCIQLYILKCTVLQCTELVHRLAVFSPGDADRCHGVCIQLYLSVLYCSVLDCTDLHSVLTWWCRQDWCHGVCVFSCT